MDVEGADVIRFLAADAAATTALAVFLAFEVIFDEALGIWNIQENRLEFKRDPRAACLLTQDECMEADSWRVDPKIRLATRAHSLLPMQKRGAGR